MGADTSNSRSTAHDDRYIRDAWALERRGRWQVAVRARCNLHESISKVKHYLEDFETG